MEKFLNPTHSLRCNICGPSSSGKSVSLTILILYNNIEYEKIYIYSPSLHQNLYQKNKCFNNYIPINIIPNILNEEYNDIVIDEIVNDKDFQKSDCEIEPYGSKEELKFPQEFEDGVIIVLDDLNEKEKTDQRTQAMFKRSRHNNISMLIITQKCYELP